MARNTYMSSYGHLETGMSGCEYVVLEGELGLHVSGALRVTLLNRAAYVSQ